MERRTTAWPPLAAALLGFFVVTLDALVVNVALPAIGDDLNAGMTGLQWVVDSYTLMFAALLLSAGALSDLIGACRAFGRGRRVPVRQYREIPPVVRPRTGPAPCCHFGQSRCKYKGWTPR